MCVKFKFLKMIMMMYACGVVWFRRRLRRYGYFLDDVLLGGQCYRGFGVDSERRGGVLDEVTYDRSGRQVYRSRLKSIYLQQ